MKLTKWYYDLITAEGDVYIGYAVYLQVLSLTIPWRSSYLWRHNDSEIIQQGLGKFTQVSPHDYFDFSIPSFNFEGRWAKSLSTPTMQVLNYPHLSIHWQSLSIAAKGSITLNQQTLAGFGYCEKLELEFTKIKLPIQQLHWGRFIAHNQEKSMVWIGIKDHCNVKQFIIEDGDLKMIGDISDNDIKTNTAHLTFHSSRILLDNTISQHIPYFLQKLFGENISNGREQKWCSKGTLKDMNNNKYEGWVIHEVVTW